MPVNSKVILGHSGSCLSQRLLSGFSGTVSDGQKDSHLDEDVMLDFVTDDGAEILLQVAMISSTAYVRGV